MNQKNQRERTTPVMRPMLLLVALLCIGVDLAQANCPIIAGNPEVAPDSRFHRQRQWHGPRQPPRTHVVERTAGQSINVQ
ncbi:MAG: hypothetical protein IPK97_09605 [Ahniella sp.]|nr:hypothetical protein [Ahniella sp.]